MLSQLTIHRASSICKAVILLAFSVAQWLVYAYTFAMMEHAVLYRVFILYAFMQLLECN